jgi:hypothetical protein
MQGGQLDFPRIRLSRHPGPGYMNWPFVDLTAAAHGIMGGPVVVIEDVDKFNAVVSQEETRLRQLHPTPDDIPTCMSQFDNFLSCNSTPIPPLMSLCSQR